MFPLETIGDGVEGEHEQSFSHLRWVQLFTFRDSQIVQVIGIATHLMSTDG
jgi:hypothetical protein